MAHFRVIMRGGRNCTPELLTLLGDICAAQDDGSQYLAALEEYYALQSSSCWRWRSPASWKSNEVETQPRHSCANIDNSSVGIGGGVIGVAGLQSDARYPSARCLIDSPVLPRDTNVATVDLPARPVTGVAPAVAIGTPSTTAVGRWSKPMADAGSNLIVALDYDSPDAALDLAKRLDPATVRLKVGKQLFTLAGPTSCAHCRAWVSIFS